MNIIGISAFFHDAACCLIKDGVLTAAAEEERFSRIKADPALPRQAFKYCLEQGGITLADVDCIAYYEDPQKKLARQLWSGILKNDEGWLQRINPNMVDEQIRSKLGFNGPVKYYDHHLSHGASSFYFSGFEQAAVLTVDGVGEWATTTYATGSGNKLDIFEQVEFPDSIGLLYSTITSFLGFGVNDGEYKVMGLAPYGKPSYVNEIRKLIQETENGQFRLDMQYFDFISGNRMYSDALSGLFGMPPRGEDREMEQVHMDIARSMQQVLEEVLVAKASYLYEKTGMENLCMAGGVALNCVANGKVLRNTPFKNLFVQPAANDAGGAIGAAALAHVELIGSRPQKERQQHVYLGPAYSSGEVQQLLEATSIRYTAFPRTGALLEATAARLNEGKVIGWFQGRMEFGPRSLGARSILADPRSPVMRDRINAMVKKREGFRPFAPAVLDKRAGEHFDLDHASPFMLETCQVISALDLPAITHVDGSARVQTVHRDTNERFYELLRAFDRLTGCPILLNTSFNIKGEPIVCTPEDALRCFITTDIDCLILGDYIIDREENNFDLLKLLLLHDVVRQSGITHEVYTFV
ncbi:carbamoyltransferase [Chitinophaga sp. LS1]|uniref:carbamoyltransferase family protein n=1 Tax=Chitinophaga sp. LS1 TaxID=3051176 RepID=UPI002AAB3A15|nr:carbamoyltransferase [Chitinophaga sp. LS1]WPV65664.1 carbamoyltransferase [Chitinophaga sp. LS1]